MAPWALISLNVSVFVIFALLLDVELAGDQSRHRHYLIIAAMVNAGATFFLYVFPFLQHWKLS